MIGGVLVERTIREVLPAVQRNKEGLEEKKKELAEFESKYKFRIRKGDGEMRDENKKEGNAQGVLIGPAGSDQ
ncbi:hypothetical protein SASPL_141833 [Salvia splendens]|uniref:Prefoldin subunit 2 n=1 Tax=Salvia splendens TaxID=180675 RepID=A0A8X8WKJ0_SALSN|nr:hypothetical protein SASPL_141833 [Salvia splendens]